MAMTLDALGRDTTMQDLERREDRDKSEGTRPQDQG